MQIFLTKLPRLETNRLILREIQKEDAEDMFEHASNKNISKYVQWNPHKSIDETKEFINLILSNYIKGEFPAPWAIIYKENNKFIGTIEFTQLNIENRYCEIGYAISEEYWGQGLVAESAIEILRVGFDILYLNRIQACCMTENNQSIKVMTKIGMSCEGVLREYSLVKGIFRDIKMFSILRKEWKKK